MSREDEGGDIRLFVEEDDVGTPLEESVSGRETGETTTDDDDTSHGDEMERRWRFVGKKRRVGSKSETEVPAPITVTRIPIHVSSPHPGYAPDNSDSPAAATPGENHLT